MDKRLQSLERFNINTLSMHIINLTKEDTNKILLVMAVIEKQFFRHFTHGQLAKMAGTNEKKLRIVFKQINSKTINEYQTEIRIIKAKDFLENSELSLKTIAIRIGLDHSNFAKSFKKLTGFTPSQWRHMNRKSGIV